jgi:hypothetical protein
MNRVGLHSWLRALGIVVLYCAFWTTAVQAQFIQQLRLSPAQPVDNQPVKVIADLFFPNSDCPLDTLGIVQISPDRFEANALHCVGLLTVICNTSDTFDLGVLPAGNYRFVLREEYGWLPSPCTVGSQPPAIDSIDFQVTVNSGINESVFNRVVLSPNPAPEGRFRIDLPEYIPGIVCRILDPAGRHLLSIPIQSTAQPIDLSVYADGVYLVELRRNGEPVHLIRVMKY